MNVDMLDNFNFQGMRMNVRYEGMSMEHKTLYIYVSVCKQGIFIDFADI